MSKPVLWVVEERHEREITFYTVYETVNHDKELVEMRCKQYQSMYPKNEFRVAKYVREGSK
jgi:hypothetical protein